MAKNVKIRRIYRTKYLQLKKKIILYLLSKKRATIRQIARDLKYDERIIHDAVNQLAAKGILTMKKAWTLLPFPKGMIGFVIVGLARKWKERWYEWYLIDFDDIQLD